VGGERFGRFAEGFPKKFGEGASGARPFNPFSTILKKILKKGKFISQGLPFSFFMVYVMNEI